MGFREKGGFIGEHDRSTGEPLPDHISAKWEDLEQLVSGLLTTNEKLLNSNLDAVLTATVIAFGFVFIHPFEDGNGRIHRYLIHHGMKRPWQLRADHRSPRYTTRLSDLPVVR